LHACDLGFVELKCKVYFPLSANQCSILFAGEILQFHVIRTPPGRGNVSVDWKIIGQNLESNFANFTGRLFFPEVIP
jgi:G-protein coupled receptor 98